MNTEPQYISVVEPLSPAIERVKTVLFRPFDLRTWFVIGFCAWLAELGKGGSGGGGGQWQSHGHDISHALNQTKQYILANLAWIIPLAVFAFIAITLVWLLITWLSSRGRFMFLHCVAENKAQVRLPWRKFAPQANSLFVFRIVLWLVGFVIIAPLVIALVVSVIGLVQAGEPVVGYILGLILIVLAMVVIGIFFGLIKMFTTDFVVPVMFTRALNCTTAWREVLSLMRTNKGCMVLYVLFKIVMALTIGTIILMTVCLTCCCAGCILAIPYIGTVLFLPILLFQRAYSLCYLRQYGPQFDVFPAQATGT